MQILFTNDCQYGLYYPNWSKCGIPLTITTWDGNLTESPAWQWPFAPRQPAAERRRHHGSLGSSRAAGYVSGRPEWCLSVAPGAQPSLTAAYLGKSQESAHAASLNAVPSGESRGFSLTQTAAGYEHLHFIHFISFWNAHTFGKSFHGPPDIQDHLVGVLMILSHISAYNRRRLVNQIKLHISFNFFCFSFY